MYVCVFSFAVWWVFFCLWFLPTSLVIFFVVLIHPPFLFHLENCIKGDSSRGEAREKIFFLYFCWSICLAWGRGRRELTEHKYYYHET